MTSIRCSSALATLLILARAASAQIVTVNTINDVVDFAGNQRISDLPGPDGRVSFREACIAANNTPGPQTVEFAIPLGQFGRWPDRATLIQTDPTFELIDDATFVDFSSQTRNIGDTNPAGNEVAIYGTSLNARGTAAIAITGNGCTIKGLDSVEERGYAVWLIGSNNRVIGCAITLSLLGAIDIRSLFGQPPAVGNIIGGTLPGEGNYLWPYNGSGVSITWPASGNVVVGNRIRGVYIAGGVDVGTCDANRIGGSTPAERNVIAGFSSATGEGAPQGSQLHISYARNTVIEGNYIGTMPDGMARQPQTAQAGVAISESPDTVVRGNVISGNISIGTNHASGVRFGVGVGITGNCAGSRIVGNLIGVGADGITPVPNRQGIRVDVFGLPSAGCMIGGINPGEGNTIAFNETEGVLVRENRGGVAIRGNAIHSNTGLGIDLVSNSGVYGVTLNDAGDPDVGANGLQNFPVIAAASSDGAGTNVSGSLNSVPNEAFALEFFGSPACDPSGFGEGAVFLGAVLVTTNGAGNAPVAVRLPVPVAAGGAVTATTTRLSTSDTSELSACVAITFFCYANCDGSTGAPILNANDFQCFLNKYAAGDPAANCDNSTATPILTANDFQCFLNAFAAGCP